VLSMHAAVHSEDLMCSLRFLRAVWFVLRGLRLCDSIISCQHCRESAASNASHLFD
jgi:hypothetical protein